MEEKHILIGEVIPIEHGLISAPIDAPRRRVLQNFQKKIGVNFKSIELLNVALTHSSYSRYYDRVFDDNEKLEFMGDAVLELASSTHIFKKFPSLDEGNLTKLRSTIVCQTSLAKIARRLQMGNVMQFDYGEWSTGGANRESNLEDAFEALIGAIYLDCGWESAREFAISQLEPELENLTDENIADELQEMVQKNLSDFKSKLQEILMKDNPAVKIEYVEVSREGPPHQPIFEYAVKIDDKTMGKGTGGSKKIAEQMAAKIALHKVESQIKISDLQEISTDENFESELQEVLMEDNPAVKVDEKIIEQGFGSSKKCAEQMAAKIALQKFEKQIKIPSESANENFKSKLQEVLMKENPSVKIEYVEVSVSGSSHQPIFEYAVKIDDKIMGQGKGGSKKIAEKLAAKMALQKFESHIKIPVESADENFKSKLQEVLMKENPSVKIEYVEISVSGVSHQPTFEYAVKIDDKIMGQGKGGSKKLATQMAAKQALQKLKS